MTQQSGKSPYQADVHWASFKNVGEDNIPAYAVVAPETTEDGAPKPWVDGETGQIYYRLRIPTGGSGDTDPFSTNYDLFAINGPTDVPAGDERYGACTFARHAPTWVLLDPEWSYSDERFDQTFEIGPVPGETYMSDAGNGFRLLHRKRLDPEADSPLIGLVIETGSVPFMVAMVRTPNCYLDAYTTATATSLGVFEDDDGRRYVRGRIVKWDQIASDSSNYANGSELADDDIKIYVRPPFVGFLAYGAEVQVVPYRDGVKAIGTGLMRAPALQAGTNGTVLAWLWPETEAESVEDIQAYSPARQRMVLVSGSGPCSGDTYQVGAKFWLEWVSEPYDSDSNDVADMRKPTSSLVVGRECCPPSGCGV